HSSCCAPSTRSSSCGRSAPSCCSVARCACTRRGTDDDGWAARNRDRRDLLPGDGACDAAAGGVSASGRGLRGVGDVALSRRADGRAAIEPHEERQVVAVAGGGRVGRIVVLVLTATAVPTRAAVAQSGSPVAAHLARADSAFAEGDAAAAAREYAVVLAADPD